MARYTDAKQFKKGDVVLVANQNGISGVFRVVASRDHNMACETISYTIDNTLDNIWLHDCHGSVRRINGEEVGWFVMPSHVVAKLP